MNLTAAQLDALARIRTATGNATIRDLLDDLVDLLSDDWYVALCDVPDPLPDHPTRAELVDILRSLAVREVCS